MHVNDPFSTGLRKLVVFVLCCFILGCGTPKKTGTADASRIPSILANHAFFYYEDLGRAMHFYQDILGFHCVLDYGFAKILQTSQTTFIGLVKGGMHGTDEPKTVTLAFIVDDVDAWHKYIRQQNIPIRSEIETASQHPTRSFTALDPEGYYIQFETFMDAPDNAPLLQHLKDSRTWYPHADTPASKQSSLGIRGSIFWLYYQDQAGAQRFYEKNLGLRLLVDQQIPKIYSCSPTGFIGLNDFKISSHSYSPEKAVNVSFFTDDSDGWLRHLKRNSVKMRTDDIFVESEAVRVCIAYDPEGYFLEFDTFLDHEKNRNILDSFRH